MKKWSAGKERICTRVCVHLCCLLVVVHGLNFPYSSLIFLLSWLMYARVWFGFVRLGSVRFGSVRLGSARFVSFCSNVYAFLLMFLFWSRRPWRRGSGTSSRRQRSSGSKKSGRRRPRAPRPKTGTLGFPRVLTPLYVIFHRSVG